MQKSIQDKKLKTKLKMTRKTQIEKSILNKKNRQKKQRKTKLKMTRQTQMEKIQIMRKNKRKKKKWKQNKR